MLKNTKTAYTGDLNPDLPHGKSIYLPPGYGGQLQLTVKNKYLTIR